MAKITSSSGDITVACSIMISDNKSSLGMVKDKSKYGVLMLTKNGLLQLQFVSKLVLSYNITDISSIFDRFIDEGKTTLRFKKAAQDIMLQSKDTNGLKSFVKAVKQLRTMSVSKDGKTSIIGQLPTDKTKLLSVNDENSVPTCKEKQQPVPISQMKNDNGKRSALSVQPQPQEQPVVPAKRRQTISSAVLKKSETLLGKVLKRLAEGVNYVSSLSCEKCRILSFSRCEDLANLSSLDLLECGLAEFPRELLRIPHLTTLNLSRNNISTIGAEVFSSLDKLTSLDLSHNKLNSLPLSVVNLKAVRTFIVSYNQIRILTAIPPTVVRFDIAHNPLNTVWVSKIVKHYGDFDISGLVNPGDETGTSLEVLRKITSETMIFNRTVPSLFEFSARSTAKNWPSAYWRHVPSVIVSQLEHECLCVICTKLCLSPAFIRRYGAVHMGWRSQMTDSSSLALNFLGVTCQVCASTRRNSTNPLRVSLA